MASYGSSFVQGTGTGAAAGAGAGPWGAVIGGGLGGLAGLFGAYEQEQDEKRKQEILARAKKEYDLTQSQVESLMEEYYSNPENFLGTREDVDAYRKMASEYNPEDYVYDFDEFSYDKDVDDFVNPYYDKIISDTTKRISHSAAGAGVGRGTGAANKIAEGVAQKEDELYNTALNAYNQDRTRSYNEWSGNIQAMQNRLNQLKAATDTKMQMSGDLARDYADTEKQKFQDMIGAKQERAGGNLQLATMSLMV